MKLTQYFHVVGLLLFTFASANAQTRGLTISSEADIKADIELSPCDNQKRLAAVMDLFKKYGATDADMKIDKIGKVENLVVRKQGKSNEIVIVGAHYDKVDEGCGAIDNWSGITILANLYRTLRQPQTEKTYLFVAFAKEESGLVGSEAMAGSIPKEERSNYCAMVNFDSFGFTYPQALRNISDASLIKLAKETSEEMKLPFGDAGIDVASGDSHPFKTRNIPAISLHGLSNSWMSYLHTTADKLANVKTQSVLIGYRYGLVFISKIEQAPCSSFRK